VSISGLLALAEGDLGPFDQDFSSPSFRALEVDDKFIGSSATVSPEESSLIERTMAENKVLTAKVAELESQIASLTDAQQAMKVHTQLFPIPLLLFILTILVFRAC